ncbi:MAG TPA: hypothetical protein VGO09_02370 [Flavisolibacter sp.]|jgi:hypothetical protein|nr:hypothetical protein [Flavisolibacter sp.]
MIRVRKYKIKDKVRLNDLAVSQNQFGDNQSLYKKIFDEDKKGEILRIEEMLPGNSNFRYAVKFGSTVLTLNETQIDLY